MLRISRFAGNLRLLYPSICSPTLPSPDGNAEGRSLPRRYVVVDSVYSLDISSSSLLVVARAAFAMRICALMLLGGSLFRYSAYMM